MATVGSALEEKGVEESEESADSVWPTLADMCRKNGFSNSVQCNEKSCKSMDSKLTKYNCIVKINGLKNLVHSKQAPAKNEGTWCRGLSSVVRLRRSKRNHMSSESNNIKLKGGPGSNLRDLANQTQSGSLNNNNEDTASSAIDPDDGVSHKEKWQRNKATQESVQNCDTNNSKHSGNNPSKVFHLKEVNGVKEKSPSNGHRVSLRRVQQNLHQNGVSVSKQNGCCGLIIQPSCPASQSSTSSSSQPCKAANSSLENSLLRGRNGSVPHIHPEPRVVLGRLAFSASSTPSLSSVLSTLSSSSLTRSSSASSLPVTSQSSTIVPRSRSTSSSLFLLTQENSCSSTSSLVSSSSHEGTATAKKRTSCRWSDCGQELDPTRLMDHIQTCHVEAQTGDSFVCLWDGCKVFNKASCSKKWLDRHILCHSGDKPFPCIVDGCGQQFTSQYGLERHVNSHFNACRPNSKNPVKSKEDTPSKQAKKKKVKRKRALPAKTEDFFDPRTMEGLHHRLLTLSHLTQMDVSTSGNLVTFHSTVIARRRDASGQVQLLLRWTPNNILSDSWVAEAEAAHTRTVALSDLPRDALPSLDCGLYARHRYRKHRRK